MERSIRKRYDGTFKAKVALEAIKGQKTISQIASEYSIHPNQIVQWKKQLLEEAPQIFSRKRNQEEKAIEEKEAELYRQIGQLKVELDWVKKNLDCSVTDKRRLVDPTSPAIPLCRQCELLGLSRSGYYYQPVPESEEDLLLMNLIDEQYTLTPYYGVRRMVYALNQKGYQVNHKRVDRLMKKMGIEAISPKPRLSINKVEHIIYPYLLRNMVPNHSNQVWASDITYIRMHQGFLYLVAIMDWYSRYVVSFQLSNTLETCFCLVALEMALERFCPEIFNTDQGVQFTSDEFTSTLKQAGCRISMDGKGRVFDNIFVERLWRTVKYEEVYLSE